MKVKCTVILNDRNNIPSTRSGGHQKKYAFTIKDLALFYRVSERTVKRWIADKKLDPTSLDSICTLKADY